MGKVGFSLKRVQLAISQLTVWGGAGGCSQPPSPPRKEMDTTVASAACSCHPECIRKAAQLCLWLSSV